MDVYFVLLQGEVKAAYEDTSNTRQHKSQIGTKGKEKWGQGCEVDPRMRRNCIPRRRMGHKLGSKSAAADVEKEKSYNYTTCYAQKVKSVQGLWKNQNIPMGCRLHPSISSFFQISSSSCLQELLNTHLWMCEWINKVIHFEFIHSFISLIFSEHPLWDEHWMRFQRPAGDFKKNIGASPMVLTLQWKGMRKYNK